MNYIKELFRNKCEFFLAILFIIFIVVGVEDNYKMARIVDIPQMKIVIIITSLLLIIYCNRILAVLGIFVAYELFHFSHVMLNESIVLETTNTWKPFTYLKSMEEEIVYKMNPLSGSTFVRDWSYKPMTSSNNIYFF
jgi:hypothetical protein